MRRRIVRRESRAAFYHDTGFGEFFVGKSGVTFSDQRICEAVMDEEDTTHVDIDRPWFEEESRIILGGLATSSVMIEGDLGSGKSTAVYGLRTLLREEQTPYVYINGHYTSRAREQRPAIHSALRNNREIIIFDSFDYLFLRQAFDRKSRFARETLLPDLLEHEQKGGKLVLTSHTKPWLTSKSSPELIAQMQDALPEDTLQVRVGSEMSIEGVRSVSEKVFDSEYAKRYTQLAMNAQPTARSYRVIKLIGKSGADLSAITQQDFNSMVDAIDRETRTKMGAEKTYSLV